MGLGGSCWTERAGSCTAARLVSARAVASASAFLLTVPPFGRSVWAGNHVSRASFAGAREGVQIRRVAGANWLVAKRRIAKRESLRIVVHGSWVRARAIANSSARVVCVVRMLAAVLRAPVAADMTATA